MASLYNEPNWSTKLKTVKENIVQRLAAGSVSWSQMGQKLASYYAKNENFSLTDVWAALIVSNMVNEIDEHKLTEQRANYTNDPYPIYTVIDKQCKYDRLNADVWFEITPDESGYSLPGAFVDSSCLECQFENGKKVKEQPEIDLLYLQGLCGSAIADMEDIIKYLFEALKHLIKIWIAIVRSIERIVHWIWGTTYDYLYGMTVKDIDPSILHSKTREYEDTAALLNSPYFSVLRQERKIDLIISLDFGVGDPFESVVKTAQICKELQIPFPEVVVPVEDVEPQDFYVFRGYSKAPTVIHIPLFNAVNCKGEVEKWKKKYPTFQMSYSDKMIADLLEKAAENIKNNKENLLKETENIISEKKKTCGNI
ncbi:hypothetical protein SRHO_G00008160 [Serrasalmus rhombeus]